MRESRCRRSSFGANRSGLARFASTFSHTFDSGLKRAVYSPFHRFSQRLSRPVRPVHLRIPVESFREGRERGGIPSNFYLIPSTGNR